eukprot:TRINITY_DN879_c0_g1_i1.p3 TRINITY_DN879_c0_g1~~TRINITY_DN879_c0_g1_i1.p3  ORF type:complete len:140 (-),score=4.32 TRINITY_DN879_c0_g1_i1:41-460(-)
MSELLANSTCPVPLLKVTLHGIEVMLKVGETASQAHKFGGASENRVALQLEECGGLDTIEDLQNHSEEDIYKQSVRIIENYFGEDDAEENLEGLAPSNMQMQPFQFGQPNLEQPTAGFGAPNGGFSFGAGNTGGGGFSF